MYDAVVDFIRRLYGTDSFIPLHEPRFYGNEKRYLNEAIDSTFVSSVGPFVDRFEREFAQTVGAKYAVATVNGTAALHTALKVAGVEPGEEVITQPLTFVATCNAIRYCQAEPVFVDVDRDTLGLCPDKLAAWLESEAQCRDGACYNRSTGRRLRACVPMHTFGRPARMAELQALCDRYHLVLVEDAAESLGSYRDGRHTGTFGRLGVFSFNGNKTITSGGGGMLVTDDAALAARAKHLTTTAKVAHPWAFMHDEPGFNYRLPNLNAALGCAQLEQLPDFLAAKRTLAAAYRDFFAGQPMTFLAESAATRCNYWLNALVMPDRAARDAFLEYTNAQGVMTRPVWELMPRLALFAGCQCGNLDNAHWLAERLVNLPSSVPGRG